MDNMDPKIKGAAAIQTFLYRMLPFALRRACEVLTRKTETQGPTFEAYNNFMIEMRRLHRPYAIENLTAQFHSMLDECDNTMCLSRLSGMKFTKIFNTDANPGFANKCFEVEQTLNKFVAGDHALKTDVLRYDLLAVGRDPENMKLTVFDSYKELCENLKREDDHDTVAETIPEETKKMFISRVLSNYETLVKVRDLLHEVSAMVEPHVQARNASGKQFFSHDFLGGDMVSHIARMSGNVAAVSQLSKSFSEDANVKNMKPRLRIRPVKRRLPHVTLETEEHGFCDAVSKGNIAHVVVDLVVSGDVREGSAFGPMATLRHTDPYCGYGTAWRGNVELAMQRAHDQKEREHRLYTEEGVVGSQFCTRLSARRFFRSELVCKVQLVDANTKEVVSSPDNEVLITPRSWAARPNRLLTYTSKDGVPYPAHEGLYLNVNTYKKNKKRYCFKVTASAIPRTNRWFGAEKKVLVAYSDPFLVVATTRKPQGKL